jgi:ABC-type antimicrobial peptide transport system permease subunit
MMWIHKGFAVLRFFLLGTMLVVIIVGIMNTLYMSIRERTREIGTMRAIGMTRGGVMRLFLLEAGVLGLFAAMLGAAVGGGLAYVINAAQIHIPSDAFQAILMSDKLLLALKPVNVAMAIAVITGVTCLAAIAPAWRAARMRPVGALHQVG